MSQKGRNNNFIYPVYRLEQICIKQTSHISFQKRNRELGSKSVITKSTMKIISKIVSFTRMNQKM